jgi:FAD synthase
VFFVQRLRGERRFASVTALQQQISRDVETARRVLSRSSS